MFILEHCDEETLALFTDQTPHKFNDTLTDIGGLFCETMTCEQEGKTLPCWIFNYEDKDKVLEFLEEHKEQSVNIRIADDGEVEVDSEGEEEELNMEDIILELVERIENLETEVEALKRQRRR